MIKIKAVSLILIPCLLLRCDFGEYGTMPAGGESTISSPQYIAPDGIKKCTAGKIDTIYLKTYKAPESIGWYMR